MNKAFSLACLAAMASASKHQGLAQQSATLAQLFLESSSKAHTCHTTTQRNKKDPVKFYDILVGDAKFTDADFTPDVSSLDWTDLQEHELSSNHGVEWTRAQSAFPNKTLFGNGISSDDVNQGGLGNCWFLAAISAIAEKPGRMDRAFLNKENELNQAGIYGFQFYTLGQEHTVVVDDYLPLRESWQDPTKKQTIFTNLSDDGALWGAIVEKAFAKYWGNYGHLAGGLSYNAIRTLLGGPWEQVPVTTDSVDDLWQKFSSADKAGDIITCGSKGNDDTKTNASGLVGGHAYTIYKTVKLSNAEGTRLLQVRNPWGSEKFKGDWSDSSGLWTPELKAEAGYKDDTEDGFFFISIEDFKKMFDQASINKDGKDFYQHSFLRLGDDGSKKTEGAPVDPGIWQHQLTISSEIEQNIWVSVNTWDKRSSSKSCHRNWGSFHYAQASWDNYNYQPFFYGSKMLKPTTIKAGEPLILKIDFDWRNPKDSADWSVVAWGDKGPVGVYHANGLESQSMPFLPDPYASSPDSRPKPKPAPKPPVPVPTKYAIEKLSADALQVIATVDGWSGYKLGQEGCLGGYEEAIVDGRYLMIMKMEDTCKQQRARFTFRVTMSIDDMEKRDFYSEQDAEGHYVHDTRKIQECKDNGNGTATCAVTVGYYADYIKRGLSEPWQTSAGFYYPAGSYGYMGLGYSYTTY